jgi:hypothetical protein
MAVLILMVISAAPDQAPDRPHASGPFGINILIR